MHIKRFNKAKFDLFVHDEICYDTGSAMKICHPKTITAASSSNFTGGYFKKQLNLEAV